jgi:hypothetical protein
MLHEVLDELEHSLIIFAADAFSAVVGRIAKFDAHDVRPVVLPGVDASLEAAYDTCRWKAFRWRISRVGSPMRGNRAVTL